MSHNYEGRLPTIQLPLDEDYVHPVVSNEL